MTLDYAAQARRTRSRVALAIASLGVVASCRFDAQPLFEPPPSDAAVSLPQSGAGGAAPRIDAGTRPNSDDDASTTPVIDSSVPQAGSGGSAGPVATCAPGAVMSCSAGAALTCKLDGSGYEPVDCAGLGCDATGARCNACRPQQRSCRGNTLVTCGVDGNVAGEEVCAATCREGPGGQAACAVCTPGTSQCAGDDDVMRCDADGQWQTEGCANGCDDAIQLCSGGRVVPSNLPSDTCSLQNVPDRDFDEDVEIDTSSDCTRVVTQTDGVPDICLLAYGKIAVKKDVTVRATGSRALALVATRSFTIEGTISVAARADDVGPGSVSIGAGVGGTAIGRVPMGMPMIPGLAYDQAANAAGGGGGHLTRGAAGGVGAGGDCGPGMPCTVAGGGGELYGNDLLVPLIGGASGGRNSAASGSSRAAEPGGGGGALELVACEGLELRETAILDAGGGGGGGGGPGTEDNPSATPGGGAGGGSGGAILIQARTIKLEAGALLVANGGGGGGGASRMGRGMGQGNLRNGGRGEDGQRSREPAAGGVGAGESLPGGSGGALTLPGVGGAVMRVDQAAGGGGGAAGRIRIELAGGALDVNELVVSPAVTVGRVGYQ